MKFMDFYSNELKNSLTKLTTYVTFFIFVFIMLFIQKNNGNTEISTYIFPIFIFIFVGFLIHLIKSYFKWRKKK